VSEFLVVTGLSGAGGSTAASVFEDLGWFVIDNLPTELIPGPRLRRPPGGWTDGQPLR
jgi:RNase adaptor protein for sRNA GlmZ degradation